VIIRSDRSPHIRKHNGHDYGHHEGRALRWGDVGGAAVILLERENELARLETLLTLTGQGSGAAAVIEGAPGIGKSALIEAARRRSLAQGFEVLMARGSVLERDHPFGVADQLLGSRRIGSGAAGPSIGEAPFQALEERFQSLAGLAARNPLLVCVDDAQWSDAESLRLVHYLCRRVEALRALVLLGTRPHEAGERRELLATIAADAIVVHPSPLTPQHRGGHLSARSRPGDAARRDVCHCLFRGQRGQPVPAHRAGAHGPRRGSRAVRCQCRARSSDDTEGCDPCGARPDGPATRRRPQAGGGHGCPRWQRAAPRGGLARRPRSVSGSPLCRPPHPGQRHRRRRAPRVRPPHRAKRVYADLSLGDRQILHARAARLLDSQPARPLERIAAQLSALIPAGDPWVAERLTAAGNSAIASGACDAAASYLRRALAEPPPPSERPDLLVALAHAETSAGIPGAVEHLHEALALIGDPEERARVRQSLGRLRFLRGEFADAGEMIRLALDDLDAGDTSARTTPLGRRLLADYLAVAFFWPRLQPEDDPRVLALVAEVEAGVLPSEPQLCAQVAGAMALRGMPAGAGARGG